MDIALFIIVNSIVLLLAVYYYKTTRHGMHILQLENYHRDRYYRWIRGHRAKAYPFFKMLALVLPVFFVWHPLAFAISLIVVLTGICITTKKRNEKKPFVVTKRIKRMYVTYAIFFILMFAIMNIDARIGMCLSWIIAVFPYITVYIVDVINSPIETGIRNKFIKKAKKKLADSPDLKVIGITGSYGKTTTKNMVNTILQAKYNSLMTPASFNTPSGVIRTINEELKSTTEVFVCEMGAKYVGDIKEICDIVHPKIAILTAIGPQHLDTFKNLDNVRRTKLELIDSLPEDGMAFVNWEDENIKESLITHKYIKYGLSPEADFYAINIENTETGSEFDVVYPNKDRIHIKSKLLGKLNILNIVCAVAVADYLGLSQDEIKQATRFIKPVGHRLELRKNPNGVMVIDDAYNSNIRGARMALDVLKGFANKKKILVTPGIVDLGEKSDEINEELGRYAADCADFVILVGARQTEPILRGLKIEGFAESNIFIADNLNQALIRMGQETNSNTVVLLENDLPDNYL